MTVLDAMPNRPHRGPTGRDSNSRDTARRTRRHRRRQLAAQLAGSELRWSAAAALVALVAAAGAAAHLLDGALL